MLLCTKMSLGLKPRHLWRHFRHKKTIQVFCAEGFAFLHAKNAAIAGSRGNSDFIEMQGIFRMPEISDFCAFKSWCEPAPHFYHLEVLNANSLF